MYQHWGANALVVLATVLAVTSCVLVHYEGLSLLTRGLASRKAHWLASRHRNQHRNKVLYGIFGVLFLHVTEIWIFGIAIWSLLRFENTGSIAGVHTLGLFDAVYMSAATFTTVGFGDLTPVGPIRLLAGTAALTGFVLITWSASFTYMEMERFWRR